MSIYRGYYEGMRNMVPIRHLGGHRGAVQAGFWGLPSVRASSPPRMNEYYASGTVGNSYNTEGTRRAATMPYAAAGAILGITIGSLGGFLFLLMRHKVRGDASPRGGTHAVAAPARQSNLPFLIRIAVPVGIGALILNLAGFIDATLIQQRLSSIVDSSSETLLKLYKGSDSAGRPSIPGRSTPICTAATAMPATS